MPVLIGWYPLFCLQVANPFLLTKLLLISSNVFFSFQLLYSSSLIGSLLYFLALCWSCCWVLPFYSQICWASLWLFLRILSQANYLSVSLDFFPLGVYVPLFGAYFSVSPFCLTFCVCSYEWDDIAISPNVKKWWLCWIILAHWLYSGWAHAVPDVLSGQK